MKTIILTGGGTAGHVTPNLALIQMCIRDRCQALDEICHEFDLSQPIWLDSNIRYFQLHDKTRFTKDSFIESIDFDYLEFQVIEE